MRLPLARAKVRCTFNKLVFRAQRRSGLLLVPDRDQDLDASDARSRGGVSKSRRPRTLRGGGSALEIMSSRRPGPFAEGVRIRDPVGRRRCQRWQPCSSRPLSRARRQTSASERARHGRLRFTHQAFAWLRIPGSKNWGVPLSGEISRHTNLSQLGSNPRVSPFLRCESGIITNDSNDVEIDTTSDDNKVGKRL